MGVTSDKSFRRFIRICLATMACVVAFVGTQNVAHAQGRTFNSVQVTGNQRVDPATVLSFAGIEQGQSVGEGQLNEIYQGVLGSGLFEDVQIKTSGNSVVIEVREFPTINRINIEGNRRLDDETLTELISSKPRLIYSPSVAKADAAAITDAYAQSGRLAATVEPKIIRRTDNRVDLVFEVQEGRVVENERISFVGNRTYSDRRLRRLLATKQAGFLRAIIRADSFVEDRLAFDRQLLTDFYNSRGFIDFRVASITSELAQDRGSVFITFNVIEGQRFEFANLTTSTELPGVDAATYQEIIDIKRGTNFSPLAIDRTINRIETVASDNGLNFVRVTPFITRNDALSTLDVDFVIERGPRIFVERIDIKGNSTTLDRVIRTQFDTVEGDPFNPREIREAAARIRAMGFFAATDVQPREGSSPDTVIVDVDVEEQPTGSFNFGGTFSVDDGFGLAVSVVERNFLGRGQTLSLAFNTTSGDRALTFNFLEPNFIGREVGFFTDGGYITSRGINQEFDTENLFFNFGASFAVSEFGRLSTSIGWTSLELGGLQRGFSSPILIRERGRESGGVLGYNYVFETRGRGLDPSSGVRITFGQDLEGVAADGALLRTGFAVLGQKSTFGEDVIFRAELEGGVVTGLGDNTTRVTDRYRMTRRQMRGFQSRGVGPRDTAAPNNDALGGNYYGVLRLEGQFPSGLPEEYNVDLALFVDNGSLWGLDDTRGFGGVPVDDAFHLRTVAGISVIWSSPIGPLRFDFTRTLKKQDYDLDSNFDFTIASQF